MSAPDRPTSPPVENTTPSPSSMATEAWIIKGLNDLREDTKSIRESISKVDHRLGSLEKTVLRAVYGLGGAVAVIVIIWALFQFVSRYYNIEFTPRNSLTQEG